MFCLFVFKNPRCCEINTELQHIISIIGEDRA
jgi:hypothetical protein